MKTLLLTSAFVAVSAFSAFAADFAPPPPAPQAPPVLGGFAGTRFPPVIAQFGPTTPYSTIVCSNFAKLPDGAWKALDPARFSLGFVQGIVPPVSPIKVGGFIYNNIDLYSQLDAQCAAGALVTARY